MGYRRIHWRGRERRIWSLSPAWDFFIIPNIFSMKNLNSKHPSKSHKAPPCTPAVLSHLYPVLISCTSHTSSILQRKCPCSRPESTSDSLPHPWLQATFLSYQTRFPHICDISWLPLWFFVSYSSRWEAESRHPQDQMWSLQILMTYPVFVFTSNPGKVCPGS